VESYASALLALVSVVLVDLALAGDNAVVVGMAAAGLPRQQQRRAIALGVVIAVVCRIAFSVIAVELLQIVGLVLAGGLLLLWVAWKMWGEIRVAAALAARRLAPADGDHPGTTAIPAKSFGMAAVQIALADVSMSLDNVLAVAGTARHHVWVMVFGLVLSVMLMGVAATYVARLLNRFQWLNYLGFAIVLFVALSMIYEGGAEVVAVARELE
jgi:YjbE family integral membrane protein